jgi:hypothetical protein
MKKILFAISAIFISLAAMCQTPAGSFQCQMGSSHDLSEAQVSGFISKINFENYRLQNDPNTLTFDNGFKVILLSATEAQRLGLISNAATYPPSFPKEFKMPVFHMTPSGVVGAGYSVYNKKFSAKK